MQNLRLKVARSNLWLYKYINNDTRRGVFADQSGDIEWFGGRLVIGILVGILWRQLRF